MAILQDVPPTSMAATRRFRPLVSGNVQSNRMVVDIDLIANNSALSRAGHILIRVETSCTDQYCGSSTCCAIDSSLYIYIHHASEQLPYKLRETCGHRCEVLLRST